VRVVDGVGEIEADGASDELEPHTEILTTHIRLDKLYIRESNI
jgi:hypothetical protein